MGEVRPSLAARKARNVLEEKSFGPNLTDRAKQVRKPVAHVAISEPQSPCREGLARRSGSQNVDVAPVRSEVKLRDISLSDLDIVVGAVGADGVWIPLDGGTNLEASAPQTARQSPSPGKQLKRFE
jgi:hypothetical protein